MKIAILGFGREGKAVLKFLKKSTQYKNAEISILDKKTNKNYLKNLAQFNIVFRSPGVPYNLPEIQNAIKKGVKFSSATQLFFDIIHRPIQTTRRLMQKKVRVGQHLVRINPRPLVIGITGTKGKSTTSTLLYKILKAAGKNVFLAGNIGKPAIELIPRLSAYYQRKSASTFVILELSSFQFQDLKHSPNIAIVLNIFKDHLDSHKNFNEYVNSKANIAKWQKKSDKIFYDASNKQSKWIAQKSVGQKIPINLSFSNSREWWNNIKSFIKIHGEHNLKNVAMASVVAQSLGIKLEIIKKVVKNYRDMEHRLELTRTIRINQQNPHKSAFINFYNDSASTNPYTAAAAIRAFPNQPKILICGGKDKNLDYSPLAEALHANNAPSPKGSGNAKAPMRIKNNGVKMVILFGENKNKIAKAISNKKYKVASSKYKIVLVKDLKTAVNLAYKIAKLQTTNYKLQTIIFSPAAASFDMFKDYKDRGEKFKEIIKKLK